MGITNEQCYLILDRHNMHGVSPKDIVAAFEKNNEECYYVTIDEGDLQTVASIGNLEWYVVCQCHSLDADNVVKNKHVRALVRFDGVPTLKQYRSNRFQLNGKSLLSSRTVFRKIICLDCVISVLHDLTCCSNRKPNRGGVTHSKYDRYYVFSSEWLHNKGPSTCNSIRNLISRAAAEGVSDLSKFESPTEMHDFENCVCARGGEAMRKRQSRLNSCSECGHGTDTDFISDWDVPRPNPISTLISARLEFKICQSKLKHQINESESLKEEINKLWKQLVDKKTSLKTLHLEFEKLESEDKKTRAKEKLEEERKLLCKLNEEYQHIKKEVLALGNVKKQMEVYLENYKKYEDFLAYVAKYSKDLPSVEDILEKYRVLCNMQTELKETLESDLQFMIQSRNDADDLTEEKCNAINGLCNKLAKVRVKAKNTHDNFKFWEALVTAIKTFIADKNLEHDMVRAATLSLFTQMCRQNKVKDRVTKSNFEEQITFIYKTTLQYKKIVQIAIQKSSEIFYSNCPNSSVVSLKTHG